MTVKETKTPALILIFFTLTLALFISCEKPTPIGPTGPTGPSGNNLRPPVANAGPDQTVDLLYYNYFVTLDGRKSYDSSGSPGPMDFKWRQLSGPPVHMTLETTPQPHVLLGPNTAVYSFELRVTNVKGSSADTVQINAQVPNYCQTVRNEIPVTLTYITDVPGASNLEMLTSGNKLIFPDFTYNFQGVPGNKIYIYDRQTGNWNTITASLPRHTVTTAVANNKIIVAGGIQQNDQPTRVVDIYDLATNTWSVTQLSEARSAMSSEVLGNKVFFAGGFGNNTLNKKIDIYDLQTNTWSTHDLPFGRVGITTVATQDKVLFSGGYTQYDAFSGFQNPTRMINVYHAASGSWSVDSLGVNKVNFAGVAINEKAFFAGGFLNENPTYHVESLDMSSLQRSSSCLREPLASWNKNSAIVKNDRVIFYPYNPYTYVVTSKFDIYNWQTNTWSVGVIPANLVQGADHAALAILGQDVYILIGNKLYRMNNI